MGNQGKMLFAVLCLNCVVNCSCCCNVKKVNISTILVFLFFLSIFTEMSQLLDIK